MEPLDVSWLRVAPRKDPESQGLVLGPGEVLVALLEQVERDAGQGSQDENDMLVRSCHVMHHAREGGLEPALLEFLPVLVE